MEAQVGADGVDVADVDVEFVEVGEDEVFAEGAGDEARGCGGVEGGEGGVMGFADWDWGLVGGGGGRWGRGGSTGEDGLVRAAVEGQVVLVAGDAERADVHGPGGEGGFVDAGEDGGDAGEGGHFAGADLEESVRGHRGGEIDFFRGGGHGGWFFLGLVVYKGRVWC